MEKLTSFAASDIIRVYFKERNCFQARKGDHLMRIFKTKNYHIVAIADGKYLTAGEDNLITAEQPNEGKAQLWKLLDAGLLSRYEANQRMLTHAKEHDCVFEVQGVLDDWMHILRPRRKMQELVQKLKAHGYCVYYLSNIPEDVLALLMERDFQGLFDGGVASCEVHVNKPDPRIYQALLDKYGLKASESVFIDDRQDNVQAAFELGFVGIRMKDSVGTLVRSLATCNVVVR